MPPSDGSVPEGAPDGLRQLPTAKDFPRTGPFSLAAPLPRFGARAVDLLVVGAPALVVLIVTARVIDQQVQLQAPGWLLVAVAGWAILYEFVAVALFGRTLGKWATGLRVVRYTDGRRPTITQSLLRALVPWSVLAIPLGPFSFGCVLLVFGSGLAGELHRGIPDAAAGTLVLTAR